jgi:hypothetical protein
LTGGPSPVVGSAAKPWRRGNCGGSGGSGLASLRFFEAQIVSFLTDSEYGRIDSPFDHARWIPHGKAMGSDIRHHD